MPYPAFTPLLGVAVLVSALGVAASANAEPCTGTPMRVSWGPVQVGANEDLHLHLTYSPPRDGREHPPVQLRAEFELYRQDSSHGSPGSLILVDRRVTEFTLVPGQTFTIGGEMISTYTASHLSLLGPRGQDLDVAGITVTGDLTNHLDGRTVRTVKLWPCD